MAGIDWGIIGTVSGMGLVVTFVVVGIVAFAVWVVGQVAIKRAAKPAQAGDSVAETSSGKN